MEENFQQKIEERLAELPADVQTAIASSDFEERIRAICRTHNLHVDQMQAVADETTLAMLGFIDMDSLASGLQQQAHLSKEQAQAVADAITHEVFTPIRESMKAWAAGRRNSGTQENAPAAPSVVMPSSSAPVALSTPAPILASIAIPTPPPAAVPVPKPVIAPNLAAADTILNEKKVTPPAAAPAAPVPTAPAAPIPPPPSPVPKIDPAQPQNYKADPYREPVE